MIFWKLFEQFIHAMMGFSLIMVMIIFAFCSFAVIDVLFHHPDVWFPAVLIAFTLGMALLGCIKLGKTLLK